MKQILFNMALIALNQFCAANKIDYAGSHCVKHGRGFQFNLIRTADGHLLASVTFHKNQVPTYQF